MFVLCVAMILFCPVLRGITITHSKADIFSKTFMIGDNLAVGAAIAILCRSPRLGLKALVWIGTALICIPGLILLVLSNDGKHPERRRLRREPRVLHAGIVTGGMLILMLYAYRATPIQKGLRFLLFFGEISYCLYLIHMLCCMLYDRLCGDAYLTHARCSADSLRGRKRYCGRCWPACRSDTLRIQSCA